MSTRSYLHPNSHMGLILALIAMLFSGMTPARADEKSDQALRDQVEILTHVVRSLQKQVKALQQNQAATAPAVSPPEAMSSKPRAATPAPVQEADSSTSIPVVPNKVTSGRKPTTPADIKKGWHALKHGLTSQSVKVLLGEPSRSFKLNGDSPIWYYDYEGIGVGSVMFSNGGQVIGWQAPPSNWLW